LLVSLLKNSPYNLKRIRFNGLIENNVIDGVYGSGIAQANIYSATPTTPGYVLTLRNNIITNTKNGYGVYNTLTKSHSFVLQKNCFYNNTHGDSNGVTISDSDICANPLFVNTTNHDYHLQSTSGHWNGYGWTNDYVTSPCIDAGYPLSDYCNEPQYNGNRINMGAYGNTIYESISPTYVPSGPILPIIPTASFSRDVTSGYAPLYVMFTDRSKDATSWSWNFGDSATSTQQNPEHIFTKTGVYIVNLTAINGNGTNSTSAQVVVSAKHEPVIPVAAFTASSTTGTALLPVIFSDKSTGSPTRWSWSFGDGATSTVKSPAHTYTKAGKYTVGLIASNGNGTSSKSTQIAVSAKPVLPVATFTVSSTTGIAPLAVTFTDKSAGSPTRWSWSLGDGATSTAKSPKHTYTKAGKYTVSLIASNAAGSNTATKSGYIVVNPLKAPVAAFTASATSVKVSSSVTFTDKSTGTIASRK
jgi:PKD repeat protein